jgi:hypothetical protein
MPHSSQRVEADCATALVAAVARPFSAGLRAEPKTTRPATITVMARNWPTWTPFQSLLPA